MINQVTLCGRTTADAMKREFQNGNKLTEFTVVVDNGYFNKDTNEWVEKPSFISCKFFRDKDIPKGTLIGVTGRIEQETWQTPDGDKRSKIVVVCNSARILSKSQESSPYEHVPEPAGEDDGLPF